METLAIAAVGALATGYWLSSSGETRADNDDDQVDIPVVVEENCVERMERENSEPGRFDNLPRQEAVYATPDSDLSCAPMQPLDDAVDNPLAWGIMPQGNRTLGFARPEHMGADVLRAPRREVHQDEMWEPIGNPNRHWGEIEERGKAVARAHEQNSANRKANQAEGAYDDFSPFDFNEAGQFTGRGGFATGQYMQERPTTDNRRFTYRGPGGPRKRVKDSVYSFRPSAPQTLTQGVPGGIGRLQEPGRGHSKTAVSEYRRDPVPISALRNVRPGVGEVTHRHQNRQSGCLGEANDFAMEELIAPRK